MSNGDQFGGSIPDAGTRIQAYWECLRTNKERKTVREILERELLLVFIQTNRNRVNEYPLLPAQQRAIIDFLTIRSSGTPLHEHTSKIIGKFITHLNKYGALVTAQNLEAAKAEEADLVNHESVLLKSIQGVVYTTALTVDNFTEILLRYYGEGALETIDTILENSELGPDFWKQHFDHFIGNQVAEAYSTMAGKGAFTLIKEQGQLVLRYLFDEVVSGLKHTDKAIEKTRAQVVYNECLENFQTRKSKKSLYDKLLALSAEGTYSFKLTDLEVICTICCMDPCGANFSDAMNVLRTDSTHDETELTPEKARFVQQQAYAMACSAGTSLHLLRQDFIKSLTMLESREVEQIKNLVGTFDLNALDKAFFAMLELQFIAILRKQAGDDLGKMQIRTSREKRVYKKDVDALFSMGLNRIRKNKLWKNDPDAEDSLLFIAPSPKELKALIDFMHFEPELLRGIISLWGKSRSKLTVSVHLNLDLISRTTTNLNQRLVELLGRFGVTPN